METKSSYCFGFDSLFLVVVKNVVPQPRDEDAVPSTDLHYVASGPGLLGDVIPLALGCTRLGLGIQDGRPVSSVILQPTTCRKRLENRLYKTLQTWQRTQLKFIHCNVFLYVNISCIDLIL